MSRVSYLARVRRRRCAHRPTNPASASNSVEDAESAATEPWALVASGTMTRGLVATFLFVGSSFDFLIAVRLFRFVLSAVLILLARVSVALIHGRLAAADPSDIVWSQLMRCVKAEVICRARVVSRIPVRRRVGASENRR